jgi:hypothetical protein
VFARDALVIELTAQTPHERAPSGASRIGTRLVKRCLAISPVEVTVAKRGFIVRRPEVRARLEAIGEAFLTGYHAALDDQHARALARRLDAVDLERRGFAYEGAGMALTLLARLMPWRRGALESFLEGPGAPYVYLVHVGVGWALALLPLRPQAALARLDPLLGWLAIDGIGFYHGYFRAPRAIGRHVRPSWLRGYAPHVFDQGLGRSLWFVRGADVGAVQATIEGFPAARHADLWSGVGLACAYAGGATDRDLAALADAAGASRPALLQGVCFAAQARERAGNPTAYTARACQALCGLTARTAAAITDEALAGVPRQDRARAYELWRRAIQRRFAA